MQLVDFHYPLVLLEKMHGTELTEEDYEEAKLVKRHRSACAKILGPGTAPSGSCGPSS